jgi:hypothetical protein
VYELYDKNGKSTTDQNEIMEIEVDYYKKLHKSTNPDDKLKKYIENTKVFSFFDPFYSRSDLSPFCFFSVQFIYSSNCYF